MGGEGSQVAFSPPSPWIGPHPWGEKRTVIYLSVGGGGSIKVIIWGGGRHK